MLPYLTFYDIALLLSHPQVMPIAPEASWPPRRPRKIHLIQAPFMICLT
jgi:hypothetical protein